MRYRKRPIHAAVVPQYTAPEGVPPWCALLKLWEHCQRKQQCLLPYMILVHGREVKCQKK